MRVLVLDRDVEAAQRVAAEISSGHPVVADLDDAEGLREVLRDNVFDDVDIVVNNAGVTQVQRFVDSDSETWDRLWRVNLRAPMQVTQRLLPQMVERRWGRIVFVSTDSARAGGGGECVYSATKAGLLGFAKSLARETARDGITSNVVCPGLIQTAMLDAVAQERPEFMEKLRSGIPMRRMGTAHEAAATVEFLCSESASYITGQTLSVNGGIVMN